MTSVRATTLGALPFALFAKPGSSAGVLCLLGWNGGVSSKARPLSSTQTQKHGWPIHARSLRMSGEHRG